MPEVPFEAFESFFDFGAKIRWVICIDALGHLTHHRQPHRDVEPVQKMLGLRVQVHLEIADRIAPTKQEPNRLVHLHPLRFKHLEQTAFRLGVVAIHKSKALRRSALLGDTFTYDHLEPSFGSRPLVFCMDITAIDPNDKRWGRLWKLAKRRAKDNLVATFARTLLAASRAEPLLCNKFCCLSLNYCLLYPGQNRAGFSQRQPERFRSQTAAIQLCHLLERLGFTLIRFDRDLDLDLHTASVYSQSHSSSPCTYCLSRRLSFRRSKRSGPNRLYVSSRSTASSRASTSPRRSRILS